jgi:hypothetical protein
MSSSDHDPLELNAEEQRIYELLRKVSDQELRWMANLLAGKGESELFGQTEFELRESVGRRVSFPNDLQKADFPQPGGEIRPTPRGQTEFSR